MFIFDDLIKEVNKINESYSFNKLDVLNKEFSENPNQFIFESDKAYELGASPKFGVSLNLITDKSFDDEILLCGEDLDKIKTNLNYCRLVFASIDKSLIGEDNSLFSNLRKFDYVKYRFSLLGVMVRISLLNKKESLLISKKGLKENKLNFENLGSYMIKKYKSLPFVKNVKIVFINSSSYQYDQIASLNEKCENITKALDHIMNNIKMDCHSCSLIKICSEVEKKVQEDFKK